MRVTDEWVNLRKNTRLENIGKKMAKKIGIRKKKRESPPSLLKAGKTRKIENEKAGKHAIQFERKTCNPSRINETHDHFGSEKE